MRNAALPIDWGLLSPAPLPHPARSSWYRLTRVCLLRIPKAAEEYARPCVRASLYAVSWYLVTTGGEENGSREECRDKFRDRSNGDAVSMLLAFAFRLSIQTPLSPDLLPGLPLPALPSSPFPFHLCLPHSYRTSSLSPLLPLFLTIPIRYRFYGSRLWYSPCQLRGALELTTG